MMKGGRRHPCIPPIPPPTIYKINSLLLFIFNNIVWNVFIGVPPTIDDEVLFFSPNYK